MVLSACAAPTFDPGDLTEYSTVDCFVVPETYKYSEKRGLGYTWEQGLLSGTYTGALQDEKGYFYFGPDAAVCQGNPECGDFGVWPGGDGGIWVSRSSDTDIRLFAIQKLSEEAEQRNREFGILIAALARMGEGDLFTFPENEEFAQKIGGMRTTCAPE